MKRLTVHLKHVPKQNHDGKSRIFNTLSFRVKDDSEAQAIVASINDKRPKNNVSKWYTSNVR